MFPWGIAKSAEAMFSRWAIKHVLKFLLKKKLGQFILGDLDLDQLDVQLGAGTIQLTDLALNVAFINQKLGVSPVIVKEGSIGSLLIKIPWRVANCQIEVEELELVLVPCARTDSPDGTEKSGSTQDCKQSVSSGSEKLEYEMGKSVSTAISMDVHEGVKTIAKMVKWLLTSFHIKVKKLIVAYDPCSDKIEIPGSNRSLVLRISEIEYGTCVSDDARPSSDSQVDNFLGITRLTNFVKFQGAVVELLQMDDVDKHMKEPCGSSLSESTTPILTGEGGGFSGNLKLSMPWKNGSLDIHKVDVDAYGDPIELRLQLSTILWIICTWQSLTNLDKDGQVHQSEYHSVYFNSTSQFHSSALDSVGMAIDRPTASTERLSAGLSSQTNQEAPRDALLGGSHVIQDWVPSCSNINQTVGAEAESDFSASIDQFFECFDGLRTSSSVLGNSGILNWTCSVFSAITAASSLASGSMQIPSEQQHIETNLKASIAGISILLPLHKENRKYACNMQGSLEDLGHNLHYLGVRFEDLLLVLQISPHETKFQATVKHIEVDDYFNGESEVVGFGLLGCENAVQNRTLSIQQLQEEVQVALPAFPFFPTDSMDEDMSHGIQRTVPAKNLVKVKILKTMSMTQCEFAVASSRANSRLTSSTSVSLNLPPFIFWVNLNWVNMLLNFSRQFETSFQSNKRIKDSDKSGSSCNGDAKEGRCPCGTTSPSNGSLRGNISFSNARVILCFPLENDGDRRCYSFWDQFICMDISQPSGTERFPEVYSSGASLLKAFASKASGSVHLNVGNLNIYLISADGTIKDVARNNSFALNRSTYLAEEILSVTTQTASFSGINMLWQNDALAGPWVTERARDVVTSQNLASKSNMMGKGYEFASAKTAGDQDDRNSCTRKEMVLSSASFLHIRLPSVSVRLGSFQYHVLQRLVNQAVDGLSCVDVNSSKNSDDTVKREMDSASQVSVLMECDSLNVVINLEKVKGVKSSLEMELPGSWHCLKMHIQKFDLLFVSNVGGITGGNLFWLGHCEGKLWGTVDESPAQERLLICCNNSSVRRGDGEGTNALSIGSAGNAIVYLWDPQNLQNFTSVTIRGGTIIAPGGRLDWVNAICLFFSLPCDTEQAGADDVQDGCSGDGRGHEANFVLNLVDIALSYEPCIKNLVSGDRILVPELNSSANISEESGDPSVACLLAAASLNISNQMAASSMHNEYKIGLQDVGLLLCAVSGPENLDGTYDVEYLHKIGYVKVAGEALVEADLRTDCNNGLLWELECHHSHINLDTCCDTASGLTRLVAQLQKLFAPDMQESLVHLQSRWNAVQQEHSSDAVNTESMIIGGDSVASSPSCMQHSGQDASGNITYGVVGLMDEICEDAFHFNGNGTSASGSPESQSHVSLDETLNCSNPEFFPHDLSPNGSIRSRAKERPQMASSAQDNCFPELIESYCISSMRPLPEPSVRNHSSDIDIACKSGKEACGYVGAGSSGWYQDTSLRIVENHIPKETKQLWEREISGKLELSSADDTRPVETCNAKGRILLKNIDVRWRMYAGSDWYFQMNDGQNTTRLIGRDTTKCLELKLSGVNLQYDMFPDGNICVSKLSLTVQDFNIYDQSKDAPWKLVLGYYHSKKHPRESSAKAFKLDLEAVRPDPSTPLEEYRLRLAFLPMLLHLDQDQLDFLINFFGGNGSSGDHSSRSPHDVYGSRMSSTSSSGLEEHSIAEEALLPFFQNFDVWPILLRVDYSPRRVDLAALREGNYVHLINLVPWKGVELQLKHVHAVGIYGWSNVGDTIVGEWLEDVSNNQVHKILKGLPPIRSLFTVGSGAAKLVSLPIKNYKNDHKLLKGIQRGAVAFLRSISLEAVGLGVHLAAGAHDILLQTEYILTSIPPSVSSPSRSKSKTNVRSNQPSGAQQGIQQAYESLSDGLGKTASALVGTPLKTYQRGGGAGPALASAVCAAPAAVIAPASAAARAVHCALLGIRNSLDPEHKKESVEKYLGVRQPRQQS